MKRLWMSWLFLAACAQEDSDTATMERLEFAGAQYVVYGESHHRVEENHRFARDLFTRLVNENGFRVFALESSWRIADLFAEYQKGNEEIFQGEAWAMAANAFNSPWLMEILKEAREHNRRNPHDPVFITGFQPESPVSDLREIEAHLQTRESAVRESCEIPESLQTDLQFVLHSNEIRKTRGHLFRDFLGCKDALSELRRRLALPESAWRLRASLIGLENVFLGIQYNVDVLMTGGDAVEAMRAVYTEGDANRYRVFRDMERQLFAGKKVFLWMHNWHAAKRSADMDSVGDGVPPPGAVSLGMLFARDSASETVFIGSVAHSSTYSYPSERFLEPELHRWSQGREMIVNASVFADPPFAGRDRLWGGIDGAYGSNVHLDEQYDFVVYFPTLTLIR